MDPNWGYFACGVASPKSIGEASSNGIGAEPSAKMAVTPVVVFVAVPLTPEIVAANIKLARAAISVFFTV